MNPYHWLILALERAILKGRRFKKIIAISKMVKKNIIDHYNVSPDDMEVIYNGVDLEKFSPDKRKKYRSAVRRKYGLEDNDFVVLFVGSGFERKGVRFLVEAVESISEPITLMIVGKGVMKKGFRRYRQNIIFCGPQRDSDQYYAAADLFVFPTMYEPFGNVHLEALASGLPVITTKESGAAEIIEEGEQGFVVERPEDVNAIAERIRVVLKDKDNLELMGRSARTLAKEFTFEKHLGKIRQLYESIGN
jgi:UDP-glucose:(heptosyl)LPS alpha-1,3-glucosyltransferase